MSLLNNQIVNLLKSRMNFIAQSQHTINKNIAHSDTPNYKAEYIPEKFFKSYVKSTKNNLPMSTTSNNHYVSSGLKLDNKSFKTRKNNDSEESYDGNTVDIIQQTTDLKKLDLESQEVTGIYKKMLAMIRTSIGNR